MTTNADIEIGTIFATTWGYSMTLPHFAKVVAKNGQTSVTVVELGENREYADKVYKQGLFFATPVDKEVGKPHRVKLNVGMNGNLHLGKQDYYAGVWDGKPLRCNDLD